MKAEHRKELETNILADKVGRVLISAKQGPTRGFLFYFLIALGVCVLLFFVYRWFDYGRTKAADAWLKLEDGSSEYVLEVGKTSIKTNPGKAARLQLAWEMFWFTGVKQLGASPQQAFKMIDDAEEQYRELAKVCKGDPVFEPEALYGLAVIEETRLLKQDNRKGTQPLLPTIEKYQAVVKCVKDSDRKSAFGQLAAARLEQLTNDDDGREILRFYNDLEIIVGRNRQPFNFDLEKAMQFQQQLKKNAGIKE